jgi:hypothetical protein
VSTYRAFQPHVTRFHSVFHARREHVRSGFGIGEVIRIVINVPAPSGSNLVSTWLSGVAAGKSVRARYTASGGAAKRLFTTTCLSPSVSSVILLIASPFLSLVSSLPEGHRAGRGF